MTNEGDYTLFEKDGKIHKCIMPVSKSAACDIATQCVKLEVKEKKKSWEITSYDPTEKKTNEFFFTDFTEAMRKKGMEQITVALKEMKYDKDYINKRLEQYGQVGGMWKNFVH
jgi:hypothetical protein